jgi:hypothetical protein
MRAIDGAAEPQNGITRGLDDYPRAEPPDITELHLDALCRVGLMAQVLQKLHPSLNQTTTHSHTKPHPGRQDKSRSCPLGNEAVNVLRHGGPQRRKHLRLPQRLHFPLPVHDRLHRRGSPAPLRHARPAPRLQPPLDGPRHSQPKPRKQKVRRRRQLLALAHLDQHGLHDHRAAATPRANTRAAATSMPRDIRRVSQQRRAQCVFVVAADRVRVGAVRSRWRTWTADAALYGLDGAGGEDHGYAGSGAWRGL